MKYLNVAKKYGSRAGLASVLAFSSTFVSAAVATEVTDAITALKADVLSIGGLMFIITLAIVAFMYFKRVAK